MPQSIRRPEIREEHGLPMRRLQRSDQLRALAHPRRLEILDLLIAEGPLTASECAVRLEDSAASCSYHLRQLARYGFIEEAEGGEGRNRPWQWVPLGNTFDTSGSPAEEAAAESLRSVLDARNTERIRRYRSYQARDPWRDRAIASDWIIRMTEDELAELGEAISQLLAPLQRRTYDGESPDGARLVDVLTYLLPRPETSPTGGEGDDA